MCVDIFAPGHPITIQFLHERLYFVPQPDGMGVYECCDAYIYNDDPVHEIRTLRIQIPHHINWAPNWVGEQNILVGTVPPTSQEELWYGSVRSSDDGSEVVHDPDSRPVYTGTMMYSAPLLKGEFQQPQGTGAWPKYSQALQKLPVAILDLVLEAPILPRSRGLLRLEVKPTMWAPPPEPASGTAQHPRGWPWWSEMRGSSPFGGASSFMARATINSPGFLREDLSARLNLAGYEWLRDPIVRRGWKREGTLLRILDHRVSLVFPSSVQLSHLVTSVEPRPLFAATPFFIWEDTDPQPRELKQEGSLRFVQSFLAGSAWNGDTDLVGTVMRIGDYINTLPPLPERDDGHVQAVPEVAPGQRQPTPRPMFDLVSKFGGGARQEHVGALVRQMVMCGFLKEVTPARAPTAPTSYDPTAEDARVYVPVADPAARYRALLGIRDVYTFPERSELKEEESRYLKSFRDLHPFSISFTARWDLPNEKQDEARQRLIELVGEKPKLHNFTEPKLSPPVRRAVVVVCPRSPHPEFRDHPYPQLGPVATRLAHVLRVLGQFDVELVADPDAGEKITGAINRAVTALPKDGTGGFLFWFLGHGRGNDQFGHVDEDPKTELELFHGRSEHGGLRWTSIQTILNAFPRVPKAAVLNCCQAGLARRHLAKNMALWTVCGPNQTTRVASTHEGNDCFTELVCQQLLGGLEADKERDPVSLFEVLKAAQKRLDGRPEPEDAPESWSQDHWRCDTDAAAFKKFAHNMYRYDVLPPQLMDRLRKQILDGHSGGA